VILAHGLAAFALVAIVRALPWVREKVVAQVKPWGCDRCMSFWAAVLVEWSATWPYPIQEVEWLKVPLLVGGTAGVALLLVLVWQRLDKPHAPPPPELPT